jgi:hypothetical protein
MAENMAKPKPRGTSRASKPRTSATKSKSPPKEGAKAKPGASETKPLKPASRLIDQRIRDLGGWRGQTLARMRALILEADPGITEEWKWMGTPVWSHNGIVCTGESYTKVVKLTFAKGATIPDPSRLFNSSMEGNTRRAIDIHEGEKVDAAAFKALVKAAVARNGPPKKGKPGGSEAKSVKVRKGVKAPKGEKVVVLLSGGSPQIAKADGDAPVRAYIAAMQGWKSDVGRRLDALIVRTVPGVRKAVKWNSPLYGIEGRGWFLGLHTYTRFVKVAFFRGRSLRPVPPGPSTSKDTRYLNIREGDALDEAQLENWVKQAAALPGWGSC